MADVLESNFHDDPSDILLIDGPLANTPAFDAAEFDELQQMIGEDGVAEMVEIFELDTRDRLLRLSTGGQSVATLIREMHTLRGAASTVAAPRLTSLAWAFEQAAHEGIIPLEEDVAAIAAALEAFLRQVAVWSRSHQPAG
jgi:HPt (histidine-containing phosphotransfer) domain-containing protein